MGVSTVGGCIGENRESMVMVVLVVLVKLLAP